MGRNEPTLQWLQWGWSVLVLAAAVCLGGGQGWFGDTIAQLLALPLIALALRPNGPIADPASPLRRFGAWVLLPIAVLAIQALPLPGSLATAGAGRAQLAAELASVGLAPPAHVALIHLGVERSLWTWLPAQALFLSVLGLRPTLRTGLLLALLVLAVASALLGFAQLAEGRESALRFYANTNFDQAVGFFANRNHLASLLVMALAPLVALMVVLVSFRGEAMPWRWPAVALLAAVLLTLLLGLVLTRSRAGWLLAMLALAGTVPWWFELKREGRRGVIRGAAVAAALLAVLALQYGMSGLRDRLTQDPVEDGRWHYAAVTLKAAREFLPWGAGPRSFLPIYQATEANGLPTPMIINHAHNDYLEALLEGGVPEALAILAALFGLAWTTRAAWRGPRDADGLLARAATLSLTLLALHSAFDYPLRTTSMEAVAALLLAFSLAAVHAETRRRVPPSLSVVPSA